MHEAVWERKGFVVVETRSVARPTDDGGDGWLGWLDIGHMRNELVSVCSVSTDWLAPSPARRCEKFEFSVNPFDHRMTCRSSWARLGRCVAVGRAIHPMTYLISRGSVAGSQRWKSSGDLVRCEEVVRRRVRTCWCVQSWWSNAYHRPTNLLTKVLVRSWLDYRLQ